MTTMQTNIFLKEKRESNSKTPCAHTKVGLLQTIAKLKNGSILLMELPSEHYFMENTSNIKVLTDAGYEGVYVSFQRPFINVMSVFRRQHINVNQLFVIDVASACCQDGIPVTHPRCAHLSSSLDIQILTQIIYRCLSQLQSKKRFVCIDSLSTMALYKPFSDFVKIIELLKQITKNQGCDDVIFLFNVSAELSQKRFFKEIAQFVNESGRLEVCA